VLVAGLRPSPAPALERAGLTVRPATDGLAALDALHADPPDVVALAADLPRLDGIGVVRRARAERRGMPICLVTGGRPDAGLAAGADDVVRIPVSPRELAARLCALTSPGKSDEARIVCEDLTIGTQATRRGRDLHLTHRELDLLRLLARHPGQVMQRARVLAEVWGYPAALDSEVPDLVLAGLCRKLAAAGGPPIIVAVPGGVVLRA
jgi:two-component system response regulator MprA